MKRSRVLVFTTCYNERENIGRLVDQISTYSPNVDILVIDDNSPDGTWDIILEKQQQYPNLYAIRRPGKQGIGSAHKYALLYAMRERYETLVTMDADFSHDPKSIPDLLKAHASNTFVTGSRYCPGGTSDYTGYRDLVSRIGNVLAKHVLGVKLHELTTYFRVFDVARLRDLPLRYVAASGYSYGVELIYHLRKAGIELREVPIHFADRTHGASKIPKWQVIRSAWDLLVLGLRRLNILRDLQPDTFIEDACSCCGDRVLAMKHFGNLAVAQGSELDPEMHAYRCTAVGSREYPPVYTCLHCGLAQVPKSLFPASLEQIYQDVQDETYLQNIEARRKTYRRSFDHLARFLPKRPGKLLEIGSYCGIFLQEAQRRGWRSKGVEPSIWASAYAREHAHADVVQGFLSDVSSELDGPYDLVVSWDVLEHVRDPVGFLVECSQQMSKDGLLCVSTLDVDTWAPRLLGTHWPWLMNMHLFYFGRKSIKNIFERAGLELVSSQSHVHYARIRYVFNGVAKLFPKRFYQVLEIASRILPDSVIVPVSLGDIRMYILRKVSSDADRAAPTSPL